LLTQDKIMDKDIQIVGFANYTTNYD